MSEIDWSGVVAYTPPPRVKTTPPVVTPPPTEQSQKWGSPKEIETRRRIFVALWAYAYELHDDPLVSDAMYDEWAFKIDLSIDTDRPELDKWFRKNFMPDTGMWVRNHPDIDKLERMYKTRKAANRTRE